MKEIIKGELLKKIDNEDVEIKCLTCGLIGSDKNVKFIMEKAISEHEYVLKMKSTFKIIDAILYQVREFKA